MANSERIYLIQGNDTDMSVCLRKGGDTPLPYDLTGASRIGLALTGHGLSFFARDIEVSGEDNNIISGLLAGDLLVGEYGLEVSFTLDGKAKRFRVPQIFEVVTYLSEDQDGTAEGEGDGISITVTVQPEVIEIAGPTGPQGKSAYQVWLDEGHTGDEDDFFRWLAAQTPNPDWAQNDASEPDYVENRTHYDIPAVSLPDAFITFRWTEEDYSDLMFYLNDETPMPRMSENTWGVQLGQWLLSCYINGNVLEIDLDGDPILTVANFRPGRTPQPILVGDIEVPELVQQLDGKYLGLKTVNGQSVKGSGDIALNGSNLEYTGDDGEYISGGDSINGSLLLLDEAVDETNDRLDNLKGSQVVYDGEDGDSVIMHGETVDQCLKELDDQAAYIIDHYQYKIPDLDTIREGAAAGATAYQKPSTGIPKSALASAVKTSLEKADTALQPSDLNGYATEGYVDHEVYEQVSGVVKYTEQELTDAQKAQARTNIAAASESEVSQLRSEIYNVSQLNSNTDYTTRSSARGAVPAANRKQGTILVYKLNGNWVAEQFIASNPGYGWQSIDTQWRNILLPNITSSLPIDWQPGRYAVNTSNGQIYVDFGTVKSANYRSRFYDIEGGVSISISNIPSGTTFRVRFFTNAMVFISLKEGTTSTLAAPVPGNAKFTCFDIRSSASIQMSALTGISASCSCPFYYPIKGAVKQPYANLGNYFFSYRKVKGGNKNVTGTDVSTLEKAIDEYAMARCYVALPPTYSHDGTPTRVIWFCNGSGNPGADPGWGGYSAYVNYLLAEGYAVIDCACWGLETTADLDVSRYNFWATPTNIAITNAFYDYVMDNFNFVKDICVAAKSQGGIKAMYLISSKIPVRAACLLASRVSPLAGIYGYSDKERATSLIDIGFDIEQDANGNITNPACMSHSYTNDTFEDATRRTYWENHYDLIRGTDPLFLKDIGAEYLDAFRYVPTGDRANYLALNPKIVQDIPILFIGAEDDTIYQESLFAFYAMQNQLCYAKRINMPSGNPAPHHAVDTSGPFVDVTTRFGISMNVPLAWVEMLAFFDNKS